MPKGSNPPSTCAISGCGKRFPIRNKAESAVGVIVDVCTYHAVAIWRMVQVRTTGNEALVDDLLNIQRVVEEAKPPVVPDPSRESIYFVILNGLIKVGWSTQLEKRLRAYGPSVEILCHYPGTRKDETELHQILTPFRAKGREWYSDSPMIRQWVAEKVAEYGEPRITVEWTEPPKSATKPRRWAA